MRIVSMIDSFKGSASSKELNQAVLEALKALGIKGINVPIADGGEGSMAAIEVALGGTYREITVPDLLFRTCKARYLITEWKQKKLAVIESAQVIGLDRLRVLSDTSVRQASSYGLGKVMVDAVAQQVDQLMVTLGGSGTSDGGLGLLQALGASIEGSGEGNPLLTGKGIDLTQVTSFEKTELIVAADVTNPYTGNTGAFHVFGKQKGASLQMIEQLDQQAVKMAGQIKDQTGIDLRTIEGAGAAGGLGGALLLVGGQLRSGFSMISELIQAEEHIRQADLVITGEGRIDAQTSRGKVPEGVTQLANSLQKPVVALCGSKEGDLSELEQQLNGIFCIQQGPITLEKAMEKETTLANVKQTTKEIFRLIQAISSPKNEVV